MSGVWGWGGRGFRRHLGIRSHNVRMQTPDLRSRLLAILAADAAGYSRLMSLDERGTVAALDAARAVFREHIALHGGRVIDTAGDSVLAVFDSAAGAVTAALAAQRDLAGLATGLPEDRCMHFRIGVHLGDVIEKADGTVYGDGVNIAARLQGLAEPGGITLSDSILHAVKGKVAASFEDQGEQAVKNIADPVRAYRARPPGDAPSRPGGPLAAGISLTIGDIVLPLPDKPSIAVLPFTNMSGDLEQGYFADGISEDIITEISRIPALFVIARNSTFTYKGKAAACSRRKAMPQRGCTTTRRSNSTRAMRKRMRASTRSIPSTTPSTSATPVS